MDRDDAWHGRVKRWWARSADDILVPVGVLPEITYLLGRRLGPSAELAFVRAVAAGEFAVEPLVHEDVMRTADIMSVYLDVAVGFVDASIMAAAERLGVVTMLTTDRRHFGLMRPRHVAALRLVP